MLPEVAMVITVIKSPTTNTSTSLLTFALLSARGIAYGNSDTN